MVSENPTGVEFCTVTSKGQIVIPKDLRDRAGLRENDKLACFESQGFIVLKKVGMPDFKSDFEEALHRVSTSHEAQARNYHSDMIVQVKELHKQAQAGQKK
ncbi:MAG: AbrB/MazE/SpoVT family DNA-binding domain-containing protein [Candidatus Micrarchaeia archaeon]|jgi:AbrB family looped-hinge helix DNA binding protein